MTELKTRGYIPLNTAGAELSDSLIFTAPIAGMAHKELVGRKEAEAAITAAQAETIRLRQELEAHQEEIRRLGHQVENWTESARHFASGQDFYRGIVQNIGRTIGKPAYRSDDGSIQDEPLALVVEEIVVKAYKPENRLVRAWRMLVRGY